MKRLVLCATLTATVVALGAASPGHAATIVNCTADPTALAAAVANPSDGDTLAIQGVCKGTFTIAHSLTLVGEPGATLDGEGAGTVLTVDPGRTVAVSSLTITNGGGLVGGVHNNGGLLSLFDSTVSGNNATVGQFQNGAGGILNQGGTLVLTNSTVSGNSATGSAQFNTAVGGILNVCCSSRVTLTGSTVSGNSANTPSGAFGGILNSAPGSVITLSNSTVSGNTAIAPGGPSAFSFAVGGVSNSGGSLALSGSTLVANSASEPNGGFSPPVGGLGNFFDGTLAVENSIIAAQVGGPNCLGLSSSSDGGYNLDDGTSCNFSSSNNSLSNVNPLLDPAGLKHNGGTTETVALLDGSPAIDAIPSAANGCGTTFARDQRGVSRPQGSACDIGAFELVRETPAHLLAELGNAVNGVGPGTSLGDKVAIAQAYLSIGDVPNVCSTLDAFINEVRAQVGKKINEAVADDLVARARRIKMLLGC